MKPLHIAYKTSLASLSLLVVALSILGAYQQFSPVPFWDMWNGYLGFYQQISEGNLSAWWALHNEHRIVITRLIFWVDFKLFSGTQPPLIAVNFVLMLIAFLAFNSYLNKLKSEVNKPAIFGVNCLVLALCFFWSQSENINWGFQSQFYLAQLIPLLSLYWYYLSIEECRQKYFLFSTIAGIASVGTMANGILILPIMALYGITQRQPIWKIALHGTLGTLFAALYLSGKTASADHGALSTFIQNPADFIQYVLRYLGSPFFFIFGGSGVGTSIAIAAGAVLTLTSGLLSIKYLISSKRSALELSLISFILYIGGTAVGTAIGRLEFGLALAFSNRYTTPAIMAWCALIALLVGFTTIPRVNRSVQMLAIPAIAILLPFQLTAKDQNTNERFEKMVAALALDMRIEDSSQLKRIFPNAELLMTISDWGVQHQASIFGQPPIKGSGQLIGENTKITHGSTCAIRAWDLNSREVNSDYVRVDGRIEVESNQKGIRRLLFSNTSGNVTGVAIEEVGRFAGYVKRSSLGKPLLVSLDGNHCSADIILPRIYFSSSAFVETDLLGIASSVVEADPIWSAGKDSWHSKIEGLRIYGSWLNSDSDIGKLSITLHKGETILYRSGPVPGRQKIIVPSMGEANLPVTLEWTRLRFDASDLPDQFTVTISDDGDGWGEWSAVAVKAAQ